MLQQDVVDSLQMEKARRQCRTAEVGYSSVSCTSPRCLLDTIVQHGLVVTQEGHASQGSLSMLHSRGG